MGPTKNRQHQSYDVTLDDLRFYADHFLWMPDDSAVVLIVYFPELKQNNLVWLDLSQGLAEATEIKSPLDLESLVDRSSMPSGRLVEMEERGYMLHTTSLGWLQAGKRVVITPERDCRGDP